MAEAMKQRIVTTICTILLIHSVSVSAAEPPEPRWWKGNLHTHSLWSDGDEFPEMIADWYRERDYNFLALTDHNILAEGIRWMDEKAIIKRSDEGIVGRYIARFGEDWVETRLKPDSDVKQVRLKPLDEFRHLVESAGEFMLIPAEEVSDSAEGKPVHINATNIREALPPAHGKTVRETMQNNLRMILQHQESTGREVLPHLNHPNFGYAIKAEDLAAVTAEHFFEVYNGHPSVNHLGDKTHPSVEKIWDIVNFIRLGEARVDPLMGIATDDSHEYHGKPGSRPGRGWVMVKSRYLTPEHVIKAIKRGDFYATSGVELAGAEFDAKTRTLRVDVQPESGTTYLTNFIVSYAKPEPNGEHIGVTVQSVPGVHAEYTMNEGELYVRAQVISSKPHPDPSHKSQFETAWTQPVGWTLGSE